MLEALSERNETIIVELDDFLRDPKTFAIKNDGKRLEIMEYFRVPQGFVIDGTEFKNWGRIVGKVIPVKPEEAESSQALEAKLSLAKLKETYGENLQFFIVEEADDFPTAPPWDFGPILLDDLNRDRKELKQEALDAAYRQDFNLKKMKRLAFFAQCPEGERNSFLWWENFNRSIDPLREESKKTSE